MMPDFTSPDQVQSQLTPTSAAPPRTTFSRRKALALAGGGTLILLAGGTVWRAADQGIFSTGQGPAYEPWDDWRTARKGPLDLVRAAILAANPHNSQPWRFQVSTSQINLYADHERNLGAIDPFLREMHIGLGCALENLLLAAAANGYAAQTSLLPDSADATWVARIDLAPGAGAGATSDLYQAIPWRHTNRYPYDTQRPVTATTLETLSALNDDPDVRAFWFNDPPARKSIADLAVEAAKALVADTRQDQDSARWYRATWQDIQQHRDGITLDVAGLPDWKRALGKLLPPASQDQQDATFVENTTAQAQTAGAFGLLMVRDGQNRGQQLRAGRLLQRMYLWAAKQGLAMQPLNAIVERAAREVVLGSPPRFGDALATLVSDSTWQTLVMFRLGYPTHEALRSPRRAISDALKR